MSNMPTGVGGVDSTLISPFHLENRKAAIRRIIQIQVNVSLLEES